MDAAVFLISAAIVLTGAGDKAFCTGGDQSDHDGQYGDDGARGTVGMPVEELHSVIRDVPSRLSRACAVLRLAAATYLRRSAI